jgi:magnesium chelatase subunit I
MSDIATFPFAALVGQQEMKTALVLAMINPAIGGVLLLGPRGTGKTTAARALVELMPPVSRPTCPWGCEPEMMQSGGMDAICAECAKKLGEGQAITRVEPMRFIELPLSAELPDVVGRVNEIALERGLVRLEEGILSVAHKNLLYVDEINLLQDRVADAILDAAAQGRYSVRRGIVIGTYQAKFILVGSMNPEEGTLRPQIMDRFGLRVVVNPLEHGGERLELYHRMRLFQREPYTFMSQFQKENELVKLEVTGARELLAQVELTPDAEQLGLRLVQALQIASHRAEFAMFEAARAHAAADGRTTATCDDVRVVAPMALRLRRSHFMAQFTEQSEQELGEIRGLLEVKT